MNKGNNQMKKVLITGRPLPVKTGLERVFVDGVLQYKAKRWMYFLPKWIVKIIKKLNVQRKQSIKSQTK